MVIGYQAVPRAAAKVCFHINDSGKELCELDANVIQDFLFKIQTVVRRSLVMLKIGQ